MHHQNLERTFVTPWCNFGFVSADVFAGGQCGRADRSQLENVLLGSLCDRVEHSSIARLGAPTKKEEPPRTLPRQEAWDKWCQAASTTTKARVAAPTLDTGMSDKSEHQL